jgi:hypothetical protein
VASRRVLKMSSIVKVGAQCEEGGEASDGGCVGGAGATHDNGGNIYVITWSVSAESVGQRGVLVSGELCGVREVSIGAVIPFSNFNLSN